MQNFVRNNIFPSCDYNLNGVVLVRYCLVFHSYFFWSWICVKYFVVVKTFFFKLWILDTPQLTICRQPPSSEIVRFTRKMPTVLKRIKNQFSYFFIFWVMAVCGYNFRWYTWISKWFFLSQMDEKNSTRISLLTNFFMLTTIWSVCKKIVCNFWVRGEGDLHVINWDRACIW